VVLGEVLYQESNTETIDIVILPKPLHTVIPSCAQNGPRAAARELDAWTNHVPSGQKRFVPNSKVIYIANLVVTSVTLIIDAT